MQYIGSSQFEIIGDEILKIEIFPYSNIIFDSKVELEIREQKFENEK